MQVCWKFPNLKIIYELCYSVILHWINMAKEKFWWISNKVKECLYLVCTFILSISSSTDLLSSHNTKDLLPSREDENIFDYSTDFNSDYEMEISHQEFCDALDRARMKNKTKQGM